MKRGYIFPKMYQSPLNILDPLLKFCVIFAITPPHAFGHSSKPPKLFKMYAVLVLAVIVLGYLYHIWGKQYDPAFEAVAMTINLIDQFTMPLLTVTSSFIVGLICLWKGDTFRSLLHGLESFDRRINLQVKNGKRRFWWRLIISQAFIALILIVDVIIWVGYLGIGIYKYFIPRNFLWYQMTLAFLLIFWLANEIRRRLRKINVLLWQSVKGYRGPLFSTSIEVQVSPYIIKGEDYGLLRNIKVWYSDISKVVDHFNSLFGIILLTGVLFNITNVVYYTQLVMVYVVFQNDGTFGPYVIINALMWISAALLQTMAIAAACDGLTKEANRLPEICYILLNDVPSAPKTSADAILKDELLQIADQSSTRKIAVSAAGFFEVNFGMMGFIVASVTSYIIVTIQFISDD